MDSFFNEEFSVRGACLLLTFAILLIGVLAFIDQKYPDRFQRFMKFVGEYGLYIVLAYIIFMLWGVVVCYEAGQYGKAFVYLVLIVALVVMCLMPKRRQPGPPPLPPPESAPPPVPPTTDAKIQELLSKNKR